MTEEEKNEILQAIDGFVVTLRNRPDDATARDILRDAARWLRADDVRRDVSNPHPLVETISYSTHAPTAEEAGRRMAEDNPINALPDPPDVEETTENRNLWRNPRE